MHWRNTSLNKGNVHLKIKALLLRKTIAACMTSLSLQTKLKQCTRRFSDSRVADPNAALSGPVLSRHLLFRFFSAETLRDEGPGPFYQRDFSVHKQNNKIEHRRSLISPYRYEARREPVYFLCSETVLSVDAPCEVLNIYMNSFCLEEEGEEKAVPFGVISSVQFHRPPMIPPLFARSKCIRQGCCNTARRGLFIQSPAAHINDSAPVAPSSGRRSYKFKPHTRSAEALVLSIDEWKGRRKGEQTGERGDFHPYWVIYNIPDTPTAG